MTHLTALSALEESPSCNLDDDFFGFLALKANDLGIALDDPKLEEYCSAAFNSIMGAALAWIVIACGSETRTQLIIHNFVQRLRGRPGLPKPNGDPLDVIRTVSPILEIIQERSVKDLTMRRVLQSLEVEQCGILPAGKWTDLTSHRAALTLARNVLNDIWFPIVGITGLAEAQSRNPPRFDSGLILPKHRSTIRAGLAKYRQVDVQGLIECINHETARGLKHAPIKQKTTLLFFAADPSAVEVSDRLRLDKEARAIEEEIRKSANRDALDLRTAWAVQASDLSKEILLRAPALVHFGCHGGFATLQLESEETSSHQITHQALQNLFSVFTDRVKLVVLNVCNSKTLAEALAVHVDCAVGMDGAISDDSAIRFACGFYRGIASGQSVRDAFQLGKVELELHNSCDASKPILACKDGVDPSKLSFTGIGSNT